VLDHCGGPVGVGRFGGKTREAISGLEGRDPALAKCPNVVASSRACDVPARVRFPFAANPPSSEQCAAAWRPYIETCIEAFGANRAMFRKQFSAG